MRSHDTCVEQCLFPERAGKAHGSSRAALLPYDGMTKAINNSNGQLRPLYSAHMRARGRRGYGQELAQARSHYPVSRPVGKLLTDAIIMLTV